jgi:hypothetical protein
MNPLPSEYSLINMKEKEKKTSIKSTAEKAQEGCAEGV